MKIIITESQFNSLVHKDIDEEYPIGWSIEEFKGLSSYAARMKYAATHLKRISSGSSRVVYMIDNEKVLKLAKNKKGLAQNETEIEFSEDYMFNRMIAHLFDHDENNLWVEMELARKVTPVIFKNIVGVTFENFCDALRYNENYVRGRKGIRMTKPEGYDEMWDNEFISNVFDIIGSYDYITVGDLCKLSTYGLVKRDGEDTIVFIDYGLTNQVYDSYYK